MLESREQRYIKAINNNNNMLESREQRYIKATNNNNKARRVSGPPVQDSSSHCPTAHSRQIFCKDEFSQKQIIILL